MISGLILVCSCNLFFFKYGEKVQEAQDKRAGDTGTREARRVNVKKRQGAVKHEIIHCIACLEGRRVRKCGKTSQNILLRSSTYLVPGIQQHILYTIKDTVAVAKTSDS